MPITAPLFALSSASTSMPNGTLLPGDLHDCGRSRFCRM
jgi:hypothetical protein